MIIDVHKVNKYFKDNHAVIDISLQIEKGEIFGFMGPNGGGKTTMMRMLCGLLTPSSGEGHCLGFDILTQTQEIKRRTGYMIQNFSFYADLTVLENLNFVARMYNVVHRKEAVNACIERFKLQQYANRLTGTLSGGWKQRVALAGCLTHAPELLLLDEPTAGVDPKARLDFWAELHALKAQGITTLVSTHYMDEAKQCDRLAYIKDGRLLIQGAPQAIMEQVGLSSLEAVFIKLGEQNN